MMVFYSVSFGYFFTIFYFIITFSKISMQYQFNIQADVQRMSYENNSALYFMTYTEVAKREFLNLLHVLDRFVLPTDISNTRNRLIELVTFDEIDVTLIMQYANRFNQESDIDRMIAVLLTLKDTLPPPCHLGYDIGNMILYSVFNKNKFNSQINDLCDKLYALPLSTSYCEQCGVSKEIELLKTSYCGIRQTVKIVESEAERNIEPAVPTAIELVTLLPEPKTKQEVDNLELLNTYLGSTEISEYLKHIPINQYGNNKEVLKIVLKHITETNVQISIKSVAYHYLSLMETTSGSQKLFDYSLLIQFLPPPINTEEESYYAIVSSFLNGTEVHYYLRNLKEADHSDLAALYRQVLRILKDELELEASIRAAFKYYYEYDELYDDIELETRTVHHKKFKLRKVFNDIFVTLTPQYRDELKLLLRFVSKYPSTMNAFQIPPNVTTVAQFGRAVLDFLEKSQSVPPAVKVAINVLIPLINYDGAGALLI